MMIFKLPDLAEGLPDAEIVEWLVAEGDQVTEDQPMVSMETAKAVVEVPSPYTGKIVKFYGQAGDIINTHDPLAGFEVEGETSDIVEEVAAEPAVEAPPEENSSDSGTVVGEMETSNKVVSDAALVGGVKVTPAVRAMARKLKVDLASVPATGKGGVVTAKDVKTYAASPGAKTPAPRTTTTASPSSRPAPAPAARVEASGEWENIRGTRRTMARIMSAAHSEVVATTLMDDADIHAWQHGQDITVRLLRCLWAGAQAEPGLNAWYDGKQNMRMLHKGMDVGMAVDTADGLFVAALRDIHSKSPGDIRSDINRLRDNVINRSIPPEDLKDYTIVLSNFGVFAGRYATPIVTPPCVSIIAAGKLRNEVVPILGGFEVHRMIPLSLTFDHRASTGGEAARFLKAMIEDLALPQ
ncbi:MAG: 2-oxo acid dehydrogenase subunit E2 [Xanthomonadales bacterium]|nr:2-oxo acid dehydrogenase subunit E2 [Xanthomonadales bacterium]